MKLSTGVRSIYSTFIFMGLVLGMQACGGGGGGNVAPVFTSGSAISVAENNTATGYIATATDANNNTVTFSLSGGTDQAKFSIDSSSGVLSFQTAVDFEMPSDSDTNNTYVVDITATDGTASVVKSVTVTVTNVVEITGYYDTGDISIAGTNNLQGMINGNRLMFYSSSSNLLYDATLTITGTSYTAILTVYTNGLSPISATAIGSFIDESSITGVISSGVAAVNGTFTLSFANTNNDFSALTKVALPVVSWSFLLKTAIDVITFDAAGQIIVFHDFPVNGTYLANCVASSGTSIQPIANTRLYSMSFTLSGCANAPTTIDGTYTGFATTFETANPDDRFLMFVTNTNNLVSIYDAAEPEPL